MLENIAFKKPDEGRANIDATIQRFEFTFELAWNFLKSYFADRDVILDYPRDILKKAYSVNIIHDEEKWIQMLVDRNMSSHTYNEKLADEIYTRIQDYIPLLKNLVSNIKL